MDEYNRMDVQRNSGRQSRPMLKSILSGKSTPRGSPSFRRLNSSRTPRRDGRTSGFGTPCFSSNRIVLWLLLITLWAYAGFYVQSRWAHGDNKEGIFGGIDATDESSKSEEVHRRDLSASNDSLTNQLQMNGNHSDVKKINQVLVKNSTGGASLSITKKRGKKSRRGSRTKRVNQKRALETQSSNDDVQEEEIPKTNATYGMLVGPFGSIEDRILEWNPTKRSGTCDRKGQFSRLVWS